jgi:hypothetical protein
VGGGELAQERLQAVAVRGGQFQNKTRPALGFDRAKEPEALEALLEGADRFYARQSQPPT